jgi:hypothetical protein
MQSADPRIVVWWRDFQYPARWRYPDQGPLEVMAVHRLRSGSVTKSELGRAVWLWQRRPRLLLGSGVLSYIIMVVCTAIALVVPVFGLLFAVGWISIWVLAVAVDTIRYVRWRRDYETALDRLLRSVDAA